MGIEATGHSRWSIAVHQPLLYTLSSFCVHPFDLLYAGVIIATYNKHLGSFPPEPLVVCTTKSTQVEGADAFMKSTYRFSDFPGVDLSAGTSPLQHGNEPARAKFR